MQLQKCLISKKIHRKAKETVTTVVHQDDGYGSIPVHTNLTVNYKLALACELWPGTCQENWLVTKQQQQGHLPSACAAAANDIWYSLKGIQDGEWGALCSRETGGTGL